VAEMCRRSVLWSEQPNQMMIVLARGRLALAMHLGRSWGEAAWTDPVRFRMAVTDAEMQFMASRLLHPVIGVGARLLWREGS
jgi:hypothetical protein